MPIYEYECRDCGHRFEALQKISDAPLTDCPVCGKASVNKLVSASAFRLKGGGWYETGNRRHGTQEAGSGDAGKSSDAAGKTPARTDPKTDTKSGGKTDKKPDSKPAA